MVKLSDREGSSDGLSPSVNSGVYLSSADDFFHAARTVEPNGQLSLQAHTAHHAILKTIVVHRVMLGGVVIPDNNVADRPAPAHHVLEAYRTVLQDFKKPIRLRL